MRLIYTDEAGTSVNEPVCVVAAIIVDDEQFRVLVQELNRIVKERVPANIQAGFVIHAKEIFNGGKLVNRSEWKLVERLDFLKEIACLPFVHDVPISVGVEFKTALHKKLLNDLIKSSGKKLDVNADSYAHLSAFISCIERADHFLRKYLEGAEIGTIVAEEVPRSKRLLREIGLLYRGRPVRLASDMLRANLSQKILGETPKAVEQRIDHIVDVPHFVEKGKAPLLQLADVCAFAFRRCLSRQSHGNDMVLAMLGERQGGAFINDEVWFSHYSSGLFNTMKYWTKEMKQEFAQRRSRFLAAQRLNGQRS